MNIFHFNVEQDENGNNKFCLQIGGFITFLYFYKLKHCRNDQQHYLEFLLMVKQPLNT